jgi:hypothetical protein
MKAFVACAGAGAFSVARVLVANGAGSLQMEAGQTRVTELLPKIEKARRLARTVDDPKAVEALHHIADEPTKERERWRRRPGALRVNRQIAALLSAELKKTSKQARRSAGARKHRANPKSATDPADWRR